MHQANWPDKWNEIKRHNKYTIKSKKKCHKQKLNHEFAQNQITDFSICFDNNNKNFRSNCWNWKKSHVVNSDEF